MKFAALLTSAGINIGLCVLFFSLYSVLRKQPGYAYVYFGRKLAQERRRRQDTFSLDRFVPSPSWIMKAWQCTEDEILLFAGLDAVVFLRMICFSIQIFSIATSVCIFGVLPMNYFGQKVQDDDIPSASSDVFTIAEIKDGLKWLWVHCLALYIITCSACSLLYCEYKSISGMRLAHITRSTPHPSHFAVLLCAIPRLADETLSESIKSFFTTYYGSSYLSHQMIYQPGEVQKFKYTGGKEFMNLAFFEVANSGRNCISSTYRCCHCGKMSNSFRLHHDNHKLDVKQTSLNHSIMGRKIRKECSAAIVFFKTRYAAYVASEVLQSSNPMMWVTTLAPEPHDMYWSNLRIPYKQLWVRRTAIFIASVAFVLVFFAPVTLVQGLTQLDLLKQKFPFLKSTLEK